MATTEVAHRRKAILDGFADETIAAQDEALAALAVREGAAAKAAASRESALVRAREAEEERLAGVAMFEEGIRSAMDGLQTALAASADVQKQPGTAAGLNRTATLKRFSRWLAAQLWNVARTGDWFGYLRLHHTGGIKPADNLVVAEQRRLESLLNPPETEMEMRPNGTGRKED